MRMQLSYIALPVLLAITIALYLNRDPNAGIRMFTKDELSLYNGTDPDKPVYLAIFGEVFDVTKGKQYYGKGGGYSFFSGRDGTRAFITGNFTPAGLIEDYEGLTLANLIALEDWNKFYHKDYSFVGRLIGYYYDEAGQPTEQCRKMQQLCEEGHREAERQKLRDKEMPTCNSKWSQAEGGEVWCADKSGGIERGWAGVPRVQLTRKPDGSVAAKKCVCVKEDRIAELDPNEFELYKGCRPMDDRCALPK